MVRTVARAVPPVPRPAVRLAVGLQNATLVITDAGLLSIVPVVALLAGAVTGMCVVRISRMPCATTGFAFVLPVVARGTLAQAVLGIPTRVVVLKAFVLAIRTLSVAGITDTSADVPVPYHA